MWKISQSKQKERNNETGLQDRFTQSFIKTKQD